MQCQMTMEDIEDPWSTPKKPRRISFRDVEGALNRIRDGILVTPCTRSHLTDSTKVDLYLKKEFLQYTGSFKERGALNVLLNLQGAQKQKGVVAASAGNHSLALAYHGPRLGIPVTLVMPVIAPILKVELCRCLGATVVIEGKDMSEAKFVALKMAKQEGSLYVNGYDHPWIMAGQGTVALEILEQVEDVDAIICSVGGGGLLAGVALAVKSVNPNIRVIGVESDRCPGFWRSMQEGKPTYTKVERTLADGLAVPVVGFNAFVTASPLVDRIVVVKDEWIPLAILRLVELEKAIVEGAGAVPIAAILASQMPELRGKRVVAILSGGNMDTTILASCLERGLVMDGRLQKFRVTIPDRPGSESELTNFLASLSVQVKELFRQQQTSMPTDVFNFEVKVLIETVDRKQGEEVRQAICQKYGSAYFYEFPIPNATNFWTV